MHTCRRSARGMRRELRYCSMVSRLRRSRLLDAWSSWSAAVEVPMTAVVTRKPIRMTISEKALSTVVCNGCNVCNALDRRL